MYLLVKSVKSLALFCGRGSVICSGWNEYGVIIIQSFGVHIIGIWNGNWGKFDGNTCPGDGVAPLDCRHVDCMLA